MEECLFKVSKKIEVVLLLLVRGVFRTLQNMYNGVFYQTHLLSFSRSLFPKEVPSPLFDKVLNTFVNKLRSGNFIANLEHYQHIGLIVLWLTFNM